MDLEERRQPSDDGGGPNNSMQDKTRQEVHCARQGSKLEEGKRHQEFTQEPVSQRKFDEVEKSRHQEGD
ncbi:hypothetical protein IHE45_19G075300 [Dioscorea alata]|uniref:Uncharacterized protein n=1 Tax=Dioscorea alata TaxID=55571 RepID=A0ACB7TZ72_DIOAL|nr:hypothetical protein IHE45_19G075300 [Dioscorea alata]